MMCGMVFSVVIHMSRGVKPRVRTTVDYLLQAFAHTPELHLPLSRLAIYAAVP